MYRSATPRHHIKLLKHKALLGQSKLSMRKGKKYHDNGQLSEKERWRIDFSWQRTHPIRARAKELGHNREAMARWVGPPNSPDLNLIENF